MKKIFVNIAVLLALALTTACEQAKWTTEQPNTVEVLEFYNMIAKPNTTIDLYTQDRGDKLPLMIVESPSGIESYDLLNYNENPTTGVITFNIEAVDLASNELQFIADYKITVDHEYGFATLEVYTNKVGAPAPTNEHIEASYRTVHKLN